MSNVLTFEIFNSYYNIKNGDSSTRVHDIFSLTYMIEFFGDITDFDIVYVDRRTVTGTVYLPTRSYKDKSSKISTKHMPNCS